MGGKQIAAARNGLEYELIAVVERATNFNGALHQGIIGNKGVGPDGLHEFLLADKPAGMLDEVFEGFINLRAEFDWLYSLENTPLGEVQGEPGKLVG